LEGGSLGREVKTRTKEPDGGRDNEQEKRICGPTTRRGGLLDGAWKPDGDRSVPFREIKLKHAVGTRPRPWNEGGVWAGTGGARVHRRWGGVGLSGASESGVVELWALKLVAAGCGPAG